MDDNYDLTHERVYRNARESRDAGRTFLNGDRLIKVLPKEPGIPLTPALENDLILISRRSSDFSFVGGDGYERVIRKHRSWAYRWYRALLGLFSRSTPEPVVFGRLDPDAAFHRERMTWPATTRRKR